LTVTVTDALAVPPLPVAVALYVDVELGLTFVDPLAPKVPIPAIIMELAFVEFHVRVDEPPLLIVLGCAVNMSDGFGGPAGVLVTVTVADDVAVPAAPVAVAVYLVVAEGMTDIEPDVPTVPRPVIETEVALELLHVSEDDPPLFTLAGFAEIVTVTAFA
jgi:hypothetical protein